jgi:hypothetical protein
VDGTRLFSISRGPNMALHRIKVDEDSYLEGIENDRLHSITLQPVDL